MKKVKIMLTAITVFALVGGALAFKAKKFGQTVFTTTNPHPNAICDQPTPDFTLTNVGTAKISVTDRIGTACILTFTKAAQ